MIEEVTSEFRLRLIGVKTRFAAIGKLKYPFYISIDFLQMEWWVFWALFPVYRCADTGYDYTILQT
jgi:hypothetical protein